jgi:hypothetical protein
MTSYRQIEANRRNALKSTGPRTEAGKEVSRRNAVRHGLTAETVIGVLEDAEDYKVFEAAITADYDAQSAVERELVLRLASILWRLRRATKMETGLFEIQAEHLRDHREKRQLLPDSRDVIHAVFQRRAAHGGSELEADTSVVEFARCFLRLANLANFALDRLSRYEANLWCQARRILFMLDALDRRKPQERENRFRHRSPYLRGRARISESRIGSPTSASGT